MAQALAEIMAQLDPQFSGQRALVESQQAALPAQQAAEMQGLDATKTNAFNDITNSSNDRGVLYSGAPIAEQQKYLSGTYLPAVANLKNTYAQKGFDLQSTLLGINKAQGDQAYSIQNDQLNREESARQAAAQLAAQKAAAAASANPGLNLASVLASAAKEQPAAVPSFGKGTSNVTALQQLFSGYQAGAHPYYTEQVVIPQLAKLMALNNPKQSMDVINAAAANLAYNFRKQNFGE